MRAKSLHNANQSNPSSAAPGAESWKDGMVSDGRERVCDGFWVSGSTDTKYISILYLRPYTEGQLQ